MEVIKSSHFLQLKGEPVVVAIGSFDGLHLGHQSIINKTRAVAEELQAASGLYSFEPHPMKILAPAKAPSLLTSYHQKIDILTELGLDYYFQQEFSKEFARIDFRKFVREILVERLNVVHIVVGSDFRFGFQGKGNTESLRRLGDELGFGLTVLSPVKINDRIVSSTLIRELIKEGRVQQIPEFLGRFYRMDGEVVHGEGRGQKIGFPTANLSLKTEYALPPHGVYAVYVYYRGKKYKGIANFGIKPTFSGKYYSIEIHIFNLDHNLYGAELSIELIDFIRQEITFNNSQELVQQINKDILYTRNLLCYNN